MREKIERVIGVFIICCMVGAALGYFSPPIKGQALDKPQALGSDKSSLSELQKLKAQNLQLKAQLSQCSLGIEQGRLTEEFRKSLNASPDAEFDWQTLTFKDKK